MFPKFLLVFFLIFVQTLVAQVTVSSVESPTSIKLNQERGISMLDDIKEVLKTNYYDKNFRGINLDERFKIAKERVKTLQTNAQIFRAIAQVILEFNDSHTRFIPPSRASSTEYGFTMQMIGNDCFLTDIKKDSDAEKKGLKVGDKVLAIGKYIPNRDNLWIIKYLLYALDPQPSLTLKISSVDNKTEKDIEIESKIKSLKERQKESENRKKEKRENPYKCQKINSDVIACKLLTFSVDKNYIDKMMGEVSQYKKMILDLRGNGGGYVKTEEYLTGYFFQKDTKIANFVTRDKTKERIAKSRGEKAFTGELIVLIDSDSASASEVFSRVIQLEKRGKIIGDVSAGAVMTSIFMPIANERGTSTMMTVSFFGMSITVADLIMSDGNRLENVGVIPDFPVGPTGKSLNKQYDPVLSFAAEKFGANLTPEDAGKFYFLTKKPEEGDEEDKDDDN